MSRGADKLKLIEHLRAINETELMALFVRSESQ